MKKLERIHCQIVKELSTRAGASACLGTACREHHGEVDDAVCDQPQPEDTDHQLSGLGCVTLEFLSGSDLFGVCALMDRVIL